MLKRAVRVCVLSLALAAPVAAQIAPPVAVSGVVQDQTGAVLPEATVELVTTGGAVVRSTTTDGTGVFRLSGVPSAQYQLRVALTGFKTATSSVRVGTRSPSSQKVVLALAAFAQEVTVGPTGAQVDASQGNNLDAVVIDQDMLQGLPVLDQDLIGTVSRFLDAGSVGSGGPTIVVNGMEVSALRVSASAVQQIKINQDPYSAEYARPGRGRIEILTKPGGQTFEGEGNVVLRDARFDARNAFASTKPAERKHILEGDFGGPLGRSGKASFLLSASDQVDDQQAIIVATDLAGRVQGVVPQPNRQSLLSASLTYQWSKRTTISFRPSYEYESNLNRGVGGTALASAATNFTHREEQLTYMQQTAIRPNLLHQFQMLVGHEREPTTSASPGPGIVVAGAFTAGGQGDLLRTETHMQLLDSLGWTKGHHCVQAGVQLPDWSRRGFFDRTNFDGTYYFSGLDTYAAGQPYSLIRQQGNGNVSLLEKQVGTYVKDDWSARPSLSLSFGARYDWQNYFHDNNNISPRASFAYAPHGNRANVIRGGVGLFTDRSGPVVIADLLNARPGGLLRYVVANPAYPDPSASIASGAPPPSTVRLAPGVQIPRTVQYTLGLDHQVRKGLTLAVTFTGARGYDLFRSRDINAPAPPLYLTRPDPAFGVIREIESDGRQTSHSVQVTLRGKIGPWFDGQTQYTWSRTYNDTGGLGSYPANDYDLTGEWARADGDRRHSYLMLGRVRLDKLADLGVGLTINSAGPLTETLGADIYNNGRGRARPAGVPRNSLQGAGFGQFDLRLSRDLALGAKKDAPSVTLALDAFNVLNRVNYGGYVTTVGSPLFGLPISARPPRQMQFTTRFTF